MTESTGQPQFSPDGQWWWNGQQWVPAAQPSYGYAPPPYGTPPQPSGHDGLAIGSLICSILGCGLGSIAGVVLGHMSRRAARRENREPSGVALAGLIIGYLGIAGLALVLSLFATGLSVSNDFTDEFGTTIEIAVSGPAAVALHSAAAAQEGYRDEHGVYTSSIAALKAYGYEDQDGVSVKVVCVQGSTYCLQAKDADKILYLSTDGTGTVTATPCG